jgi:hypothetical protein
MDERDDMLLLVMVVSVMVVSRKILCGRPQLRIPRVAEKCHDGCHD